MCGIVGFYLWEGQASDYKACLDAATDALSKRGPDSRGSVLFRQVGLGHTRLSIIDISEAGSQPMTDASGRYVIVFNGEIYNYKPLREQLSSQGVLFHSRTDTEVLLNLYILYREKCLELINGFFAFAVYDTLEGSLFIARDRLGIKPLLFYQDDQKIIFSSEMKALLAFPIRKELDITSLYFYLQLNYIPAPSSVLKHVKKLEPGTYMTISANGHMAIRRYYRIAYDPAAIKRNRPHDYEASQKTLRDLLTDSVQLRLVADVPLGAFLSGGIDSSIIAGLAARMTDKLNTFSIGFKDEPYFDETRYANLMAEKLKTQHTVFSLTTDDLYAHLTEMLDYVDEPFADSSALAVYILSKHTRRQVTVALSGDGADELFAGYNKHLADYRARQRAIRNALIRLAHPVLLLLPASRNNAVTNLFRQAQRYAEGLALNADNRYWRWCTFIPEEEAIRMLLASDDSEGAAEYLKRKKALVYYHKKEGTINDSLYADMHLVLPNDMLTKVDMMSMANSLEVRVPFLDHRVVDFVFSLPAEFKLHKGKRKRILKDAFQDLLPPQIQKRGKQGFEVPLLRWFRGELRPLITNDLLSAERIRSQGLFDVQVIEKLKQQLFSASPGEAVSRVWGLIVFQYWYKKYLD